MVAFCQFLTQRKYTVGLSGAFGRTQSPSNKTLATIIQIL